MGGRSSHWSWTAGGRPAIGALSINRWRVSNVGYRGVSCALLRTGPCGAFSSNGRGGFLVKSPAWLVVGAPIAATEATNQAPVRIAGDVVATRPGV